jgi:molybdopterin synthase sulfur carrier subunit
MKLIIPESLKSTACGQKEIELSANNMEEFKKMLEEKEPELYTRVYDEKGNQRKFVNIYLNDKNIKYRDKYEITDNDRLTLITAVAGG